MEKGLARNFDEVIIIPPSDANHQKAIFLPSSGDVNHSHWLSASIRGAGIIARKTRWPQ